jgi:hypothetical protein
VGCHHVGGETPVGVTLGVLVAVDSWVMVAVGVAVTGGEAVSVSVGVTVATSTADARSAGR